MKMTVGLPLYKSRKTAWLALSSLCAQRDVTFSWELVVMEEDTEDMVGEETIRFYEKRLAEVGCVSVKYKKIDEWIPLSLKWLLLADMASPSSKIFVLQACDDYSQPYRLAETWEARLSSGLFDGGWIQSPSGPFWNLHSQSAALFDWDAGEQYHPCALNIAVATSLLRKIDKTKATVRRGVDGWLYKQCGCPLVFWMSDEHAHLGVCVDGLNKLSLGRGGKIARVEPPFVKTDWVPEGNLPKKIASWLRDVGKTLVPLVERWPKITVAVVFSRNDEGMIQRLMSSINNLIYENIEFVRLNNRERKWSIGRCFNELVRQASGEYIAFIGDDDWVMPDYLTSLMVARARAIEAGDDPVGIVSNLTLIDEKHYSHVSTASPGAWKREYLLNHPFDENLGNKVTASMMKEASRAKRNITQAAWYYGYMYYQHAGNASGNHWGKDGV